MTKGHLGGPVEFGLRRTVRRLDGKTSYDRRQIPCVVIDIDFLRQLSALSCLIPHEGMLVGRILATDSKTVTLPYVLSLNRVPA